LCRILPRRMPHSRRLIKNEDFIQYEIEQMNKIKFCLFEQDIASLVENLSLHPVVPLRAFMSDVVYENWKNFSQEKKVQLVQVRSSD
jgi:hypothetical protein